MADSEITRLQVTITPNLRELDAGLKAVVDRARATASAVATDLNTAFEKADREAGQKIGALTDKMRGLGVGMSVGVTAPLVMAGKAMISNAVAMNSLKRGLDAVSPSASAAAREMEQLKEVAKLPGLGYKEAIQLAVGLQATGVAADEAQRYMKAFGNAIATVGGGKAELAAVGRQLQQMSGKAKPMMQDIRIIQEYVPQMLQAMKKIYGTTDTEELQKMGITTKQFLRDIVGELEKLPQVTSGIQIELENFSDAWFRFSASMGEKAVPALTELLQTGSHVMDVLNGLPGPLQNTAIALGVATAAAGPLLVVTASLIRAKVTLAETLDVLRVKRVEEAAWIARITGLQSAEVVSTGRLAVWKARAATAGAGLVAGTRAFVAMIPAMAAIGVVASAVGQFSEELSAARQNADSLADSVDDVARRMIGFNARLDKSFPDEKLRSRSGAGALIKQIAKLERDHNDVAVRMTEAQRALAGNEDTWAKWKHFLPGTAHMADAWVGTGRAKAKDLETLQSQENEAWDKLNAAKDKLRAAGWTRAGGRMDPASTELTEDARKALAANAEQADMARLELAAIREQDKYQKQRLEAYADYAKDVNALNKHVTEVREKTGVVLDTTAQTALLEEQYNAKLRKINEEQKQAAQEHANAVAAAKISLQAVQATNAYESERLQVQAELVQKLAELQKSKGDEVQVRLAYAEAQKQITEINKRQMAEIASERLAEAGAGAMAAAINADDERAQADIEAGITLQETLLSLYDKGAAAAQRAGLAWSRYWAAIRKNDKDAKAEAERKQKESYESKFGFWQRNMEARASAIEDAAALSGGDMDAAKAQAMAIRKQVTDADIADKMKLAKTEEERAALKAEAYSAEVKYQRELLDLENQRSKAVLDRAKSMQEEQQRLAEEVRQRQMAERQAQLAAAGQTMTALDLARRSAASGMKAGLLTMERPYDWRTRTSRKASRVGDNPDQAMDERLAVFQNRGSRAVDLGLQRTVPFPPNAPQMGDGLIRMAIDKLASEKDETNKLLGQIRAALSGGKTYAPEGRF